MPSAKTVQRTPIKADIRLAVLTEAGYRCAVPTCRTILALDLHHIIEVQEDGPNELSNLIALCPTCHALYTRGTISRESINVWKTVLVALNHAFDKESISNLLFLRKASEKPREQPLLISGDGVLKFSHLIASGLADYHTPMINGSFTVYFVYLTEKGNRIINAWFSGNRDQVRQALNDISEGNKMQ